MQLARSPLAFVQGSTQEYRATFEQERCNLANTWRDERDGGKSVLDRAKETSKEILSVFEKVAGEVIQSKSDTEQKFREAIKRAKEADNMDDQVWSPIIHIADYICNRLAFIESRETLLRRVLELYKSEETFVILIVNTRASVRDFLAKINLTAARQEYEAACQNSKALASQCATSGQRDDFLRFLEPAMAEVKNFYEKFDRACSEFVGEFKDIFVGPVGPKVIDELIDPGHWERFSSDIERTDVQAELRKLYDDDLRYWGVDSDDLNEQQLEDLKNVWKIELERLMRGLREVAGEDFESRLKAVVKEDWLRLREMLKNSKGGGE